MAVRGGGVKAGVACVCTANETENEAKVGREKESDRERGRVH